MILLEHSVGHSNYFSSLVSGMIPMNLLTILFSPFIIICWSSKFNSILMLILYIPIGLAGLVVFILFSAILYPFAVVGAIWHKFSSLFSIKIGFKKWIKRFAWFLVFLLLGWFLILISSILDVFIFSIDLFKRKLKTWWQEGANKDHNMNFITF